MEIKILKDFIGNVQGQSVRFSAGQVREVNESDAHEFVRGHYAEKLDKPAVKIITKREGVSMKVK